MSTTRAIPYRRKREDKTNYKRRMKLLLGNTPRLVIRKSLKNMIVQVIAFGQDGDQVIVSAHSRELKKYAWPYTGGNLPSAYLTGLLAGKKALTKKYIDVIVDLGMQSPVRGSRLFAAIKGAVDAGMHIPHTEENFPSAERISGEHIAKNPFIQNPAFKEITKAFEQCKENIMKG